MKIKFTSNNEDEYINYETSAIKENNTYIFSDKTVEDTKMGVSIINNKNIYVSRIGNVNMNFELVENERTQGTFETIEGLEFEFEVNCLKIDITYNSIYFEYEYYFDNEFQSNHKISIIIDENA